MRFDDSAREEETVEDRLLERGRRSCSCRGKGGFWGLNGGDLFVSGVAWASSLGRTPLRAAMLIILCLREARSAISERATSGWRVLILSNVFSSYGLGRAARADEIGVSVWISFFAKLASVDDLFSAPVSRLLCFKDLQDF